MRPDMKKILLASIAALSLSAAGFAEDFGLGSVKAGDLKVSQEGLQAVPAASGVKAVTRAPNIAAAALDMTLKLPFKTLGSRLQDLPGAKVTPIEPSEPVLFREGDHIVFTNVSVNYNGIEAEPTIKIKPFFEGNNRLAIKVVKVEADISMGPKRSGFGGLDKDGLMEMVMNNLSSSMLAAVDKAFAGNRVPLRARDVMSFRYDRTSWTLHANVTTNFVAPLLPGLIKDVSLTSFNFDDSGFSLSVKADSATSIAQLPGFNLAMSDGLLTNFIKQFTDGGDFELMPSGHEGGVKFCADGHMELAGKVHMTEMTFKPNVYFRAQFRPVLTARNTITVQFMRVDVSQAYGVGVPGFLNNWLQKKIIRGVTNAITSNAQLAKVMTAQKLDDRTVRLTLKNSAFLPSFAKGASIENMRIGNGLLYLAFEL